MILLFTQPNIDLLSELGTPCTKSTRLKRYFPGGRRYPALGDCGRDGRGGPIDSRLPRLVGVQRVVDRVGVPS